MIGTALSHFKITAKLGEGGMGEVYRAEDAKLGREVAIKVLPEAVASDPERLARFEREAKVVASLNHPNIAAIYQVEQAEGVHFLVMELVEGMDLHERLGGGPVPIEQTLPIASQMAQALEAAHEKGVIHRDLKPANVRITSEGQVKVLDFGLAKALDTSAEDEGSNIGASPAALSLSPTLTQQMTSAGIILGTAAYMSPEQAKGEPVDKRADIWSFGLVVFEMLTGRKLFAADSVAETLAGVIKTEIDFNQLPNDLPSEMGRLLRRCLERDAKNRLHDIADARIVIEDVLAGRVEEVPQAGGSDSEPASRWKTILPYTFGALGLALGLMGIWQPWSTSPRKQDRTLAYKFNILPPEDTVTVPGIAISPDGKSVALVAKGSNGQRELWVRDLDDLEPRKISGSVGARYPFWSPDSRQIGFFARGELKVTDLIGSTPSSLAAVGSETFERGAAWGANGDIVYAPLFTGGLLRIASSGGEPESVTIVESGSDIGTHRFPSFLPDGRRFVFYGASGSGTEPGLLLLGDLESGETKTLGPSSSMAVFAEPDFLLHVRGKTLVAQHIDLETLELKDDPRVLDVDLPGSFSVSGHRTLSVAHGTLIYRPDTRPSTKLVWVERSGKQIGDISGDRGAWEYAPRISPDGRQLAAGVFESTGSSVNILLHDLDREIATPFLPTDGDQQVAAWSPNGDRIAYELIRSAGDYALFVAPVAHPEQKRQIHVTDGHPTVEFFTPDGQGLVFSHANEKGLGAMWLLSLEEGSEPVPFLRGPGSRGASHLSPDGDWVAYMSSETGQMEVYVSPFAGDGQAIRISSAGGMQPLWSRDGAELFYVNAVGEIVAVPVTTGDPPVFGTEKALFQARLEEAYDRQYDVSADGRRFVLNQRDTIGATPIVVITDWQRLIDD